MVKKILFIIVMLLATYFTSFIVMYNETLGSIESIINSAIKSNDTSSILAYNDYYINTPMYYNETNGYVVQINNTYDEDIQSITIIIIDQNKIEGDQSELQITCSDTQRFTDIFYTYDEGNIAVITLYQTGDDEFTLDSSCSSEPFQNVTIITNDGQTLINLDNQIGFVATRDIVNDTAGYTVEEIEAIQYPNGLIKPIIVPIIVLWTSVFGLIYIYKKVIKKNKNKRRF